MLGQKVAAVVDAVPFINHTADLLFGLLDSGPPKASALKAFPLKTDQPGYALLVAVLSTCGPFRSQMPASPVQLTRSCCRPPLGQCSADAKNRPASHHDDDLYYTRASRLASEHPSGACHIRCQYNFYLWVDDKWRFFLWRHYLGNNFILCTVFLPFGRRK